MRIANLLTELQILADRGKFTDHFVTNASGTNIIALDALRVKLGEAMSLPALASRAKAIYESPPLRLDYESVVIEKSVYVGLRAQAAAIDSFIEAILTFLGAFTPVTGSEISVKLPPVSQLSDVILRLEKTEKMFSQALSILEEPTTIKVVGWENGSLWVDLAVGSAAGVALIGGVTWAAACAYKKYQEGRLVEKVSEGFGIRNEMLSSLRESVSKAIDSVVEAEAKRLDAKHSKGKGDPETIQRLQFCIRQTFDMIKEGTEIHPALMAPEEVKNVFPNMAEILALPSTQKLLKEHSDASDSPDLS